MKNCKSTGGGKLQMVHKISIFQENHYNKADNRYGCDINMMQK